MSKRRKRTTHSFWIDILRQNSSGKSLSRSARGTRLTNPTTTQPISSTSTENEITDTGSSKLDGIIDSDLNRSNDIRPVEIVGCRQSSPLPSFSNEESQAITTKRPLTIYSNEEPCKKMKHVKCSEFGGGISPDLENGTKQNDVEQRDDDNGGYEGQCVFEPFEMDESFRTQNQERDNALASNIETACFPVPLIDASPTRLAGPQYPERELIYSDNGTQDDEARPESGDGSSDENPLHHNFQIWKAKVNLAAVLSVVSSVRFTVHQYNYTRDALQDAGANPTWPSFPRTHKYFRTIIETCFPKSTLVKLPKTADLKRATLNEEERSLNAVASAQDLGIKNSAPSSLRTAPETEMVRVFLPSSWAKTDVATSVVFDQMFPSFYEGTHIRSALENSLIIRDRESITSSCDHIFLMFGRQQVRCGPGSEVEVSVRSQSPNFETNFRTHSLHDSYVLHATTVATWNVTLQHSKNHSVERTLKSQFLSSRQRVIISSLATASSPNGAGGGGSASLIPGDICTLLRSGHGIPSVTMIWISLSSNPSHSDEEGRSLEILQSDTVDTVVMTRSASSDQGHSPRAGARSYGILADGTPFIIYRILLYCDDFQKSSAMCSKGSAGGCYFLPLSLPPEARRNTSSVRIISLTPPGVSTNQVLHYIVEDLVKASVHGIDGRTPMGDKVKIFTDVVGFVGDYPASASVVDVVGHVCNAPCTHCSFKRLPDAHTQGSRYGYTTKVHANNSSFMRHGDRHISLRGSGINDQNAITLGMVSKDKYSQSTSPLLYLQQKLDSNRSRSALTSDGLPVVSNFFDAFRCNVVAADHLLTGLAKDVRNATFKTLPQHLLRIRTDKGICEALRDNGLLPQKQVYNQNKKALHSMTLSELFCVLLVSVPTVRIIIGQCPPNHIVQECFELLEQFQRLVALTYWWPVEELDGRRAVSLVHEEKETYFSDLKMLSKRYVEQVDNICRKSEQIKQCLDKPNLHRLIELYEHTIPAFGHVREVMELVFESAHQPLKRCISRSNNRDAHIFAVEHCVGNDWQGRIAAFVRNLSLGDERTKIAAKRGIRRTFLGNGANLLHEEKDKEFIEDIDTVLHKLFTPAVRKQFEKDDMISNFSLSKTSTWKARSKCTNEDLHLELCTHLALTRRETNKMVSL